MDGTIAREGGLTLSQQEAEAVFELWAKRHAETEALRSRLTVQDMAEAMSLSPAEVEDLLHKVRRAKALPPAPMPIPKAKPVNYWLIGIASFIWVLILVGACFAAYGAGRANRERIYEGATVEVPAPAIATPVPFTELAPPAEMPEQDIAKLIPPGITVAFQGYQVHGNAGVRPSEDEVMAALQKVVDQVASPPTATPAVLFDQSMLLRALQENDPNLVNHLVKFSKLSVTYPVDRPTGQVAPAYEINIPYAIVSDPVVKRLVREEQQKRLRIAANRARDYSPPVK